MLFGTSNGSVGMIGRRATIVSSSGLIRTVSFQPSSFASGGMMMLSQVTRLITWTSNRWKWIGWRVHAVVGDLPDLGAVGARARSAGTLTSPVGQVGPVDDLRRRVDVRVEQ